MSGRGRHANQKELNQQFESSSSKRQSGRFEKPAYRSDATTTIATPEVDRPPAAKPPWIPTADELQQAREAMLAHARRYGERSFSPGLLPDRIITDAVLKFMENPEDLDRWIFRRVDIPSSIQGLQEEAIEFGANRRAYIAGLVRSLEPSRTLSSHRNP